MKHINIKKTLIETLNKHRGNWPFIAAKAGVSYSWVTHVVSGHTPNPRVDECQRVLDILKKIDDEKLQFP